MSEKSAPKRAYTGEFKFEASGRQVIAARTTHSISELVAENSQLSKELAGAKLDIKILRKATAYFAEGSR
jgi:transposase